MRKIYYLKCPISHQPKYVGQTKRSLHQRLKSHIYEFNRMKRNKVTKTHKYNWMNKLNNLKLLTKLEIVLIEECDKNVVDNREIYWIQYYKHLNLVNSSEGGHSLSEESRRKISESKKGNKNPCWGRKLSDQHKKKLLSGFKKAVKLNKMKKSLSTRQKISDVQSEPILLLDQNRKIIQEFKNARLCGEFLNCGKANVLHAIWDKRPIQKKYWVIKKPE